MVFLNERGNTPTTRKEDIILMASMKRPERPPSKPLHNFILPADLRWGNQRQLRCMNVNSNDEDIPADVDRSSFSLGGAQFSSKKASDSLRKRKHRGNSPLVSSANCHRRSDFNKAGFDFKVISPTVQRFRSSDSDDGGNGIAAVREKLMCDIRTAADKMKGAILKEDRETMEQYCNNSSSPGSAPVPASMTVDSDGTVRPWTLRTRRTACKSPSANGQVPDCAGETKDAAGRTCKGLEFDVMNKNLKPRNAIPTTTVGTPSIEKKDRAKLSLPLTKSEIEEDFMTFTGRKPHRRPQKRPRYVQKQMDTLFPGLWLTEVTADMYKVAEQQ